MINILISIKKPYSDLILEGKKSIELRKTRPRLKNGDRVTLWIYESGTYGAKVIVGKCQMVSYVTVTNEYTKVALDKIIKDACITEDYMRAYLPFYKWGVKHPQRMCGVDLHRIGIKRAPQSWQYITDEQVEILEQEGGVK